MAALSLSDEELRATVAQFRESGTITETAKALGLARDTIRNRLFRAAERGILPEPSVDVPVGFAIRERRTMHDESGQVRRQTVVSGPERGQTFTVGAGHRVKGESALVDAEGRTVARWIKTTTNTGPLPLDDVIQACQQAFDGYPGRAKPLPVVRPPESDLLTLIPCADWHLGLYVWGRETNGENWNLDRAETVIMGAAQRLLAMTPPSETCVVLGGGDLFHSDDFSNATPASRHPLDVDGRWSKVFGVGVRLMARVVELAAQHHGKTLVRILPGNHDLTTAIAVAHCLDARFHDDERIEIDLDPSLFWFHEFGQVMLAATHGHQARVGDLPTIAAGREAEMWGRTRWRYGHGFHVHHRSGKPASSEHGGMAWETHQSPAPQDAWHHGQGFVSGRTMQAITYHRAHGEMSRATINMAS